MIGFWYGALLVAGPGSLVALQDVIVVLYNCLFLLFSLQRVQPILTWFELNSSQLSRLDQMCSPACQHSSLASSNNTPNLSESREQSDNHIELQNVSFGYGQQLPVLRNLNLVIPRGKLTLIHGAVGSGKSTLLKLMNGELPPLQGKMLMDGFDMNYTHLATSCLSSRGIVDFDPLFFEETVFRNISFGRHDFWNVTLNQVIHACQLVGLHDTINQWPLKYATVLYRNALSLSSSQRKQ
jgi:ABC-type bacteriocin/lantibiotic exporter with double-glycine peptidase domain